ncbi:HAD family hydrolase [Bacillus sp. REN16]|uniref:HAD family hydrolase n=1 Tax=Bacillus sp. REN16 TaxID=2887296 RepID=UPI001E39BB0E|nr:HAD family hydrolase [Bacillus sp. REN16]MCC3356855.1 HAD family hydrolase [Bacillus sp. REN16]
MKSTLLVSDLDGTLLDSNQKISEVNKQAIAHFKKHGGLFTLATGRMEQSVHPFVEEIRIDLPVILYNGAKIYCPRTKEVIYERKLENYGLLAKRLMSIDIQHQLGFLLYRDGEVYTHNRNEIVRVHEQKDGVTCKSLHENMLAEPITKILLISPSTSVLQQCEKLIQDFDVNCELIYSEKSYLEILPTNTSKGNALQELVRYLQRSDLKTIAVGDNLNDVSMLQAATQGYVVENCHEQLKTKAFRKTVHHELHAIADIIFNNLT